MQTVIGLGKAGCNIAECLKEHPQYDILKIDAGLKKTKKTLGLKEQVSSELYEQKIPRSLSKFLENVGPETLLITSCGAVSGASLRILEKIKDKTKITLLYVIPDKEELSEIQKLQNELNDLIENGNPNSYAKAMTRKLRWLGFDQGVIGENGSVQIEKVKGAADMYLQVYAPLDSTAWRASVTCKDLKGF